MIWLGRSILQKNILREVTLPGLLLPGRAVMVVAFLMTGTVGAEVWISQGVAVAFHAVVLTVCVYAYRVKTREDAAEGPPSSSDSSR